MTICRAFSRRMSQAFIGVRLMMDMSSRILQTGKYVKLLESSSAISNHIRPCNKKNTGIFIPVFSRQHQNDLLFRQQSIQGFQQLRRTLRGSEPHAS